MTSTLPHCHDAHTLAETLAQRCDHARPHGESWIARCPAHDDRTPSLHITPKTTKVVLHCFAHCTAEAVMQALGLTMADLFVGPLPANGHRRILRTYDYYDAHGTLRHQTVRYDDPEHRFGQRRPHSTIPGEFISKDVFKDITPLLYNLPAVLAALQRGDEIHLAEGERDSESLIALGLVSTTAPMGATYWHPSFTATLTGADVVLWPDNDTAGQERVTKLQKMLTGKAKRLRIAAVPQPHKDVTDWVASGATRVDVDAAVPADTPVAPKPTPGGGRPLVIDMDTVTSRSIEWLWYPYLALGKLCILDGDPGVGKSLLAAQLAANVSKGHPMPDQHGQMTLSCGTPGMVVFIATEDDLEDTVKPRLEKAGADCSKVKVFNEWEDSKGDIQSGYPLKAGHCYTTMVSGL